MFIFFDHFPLSSDKENTQKLFIIWNSFHFIRFVSRSKKICYNLNFDNCLFQLIYYRRIVLRTALPFIIIGVILYLIQQLCHQIKMSTKFHQSIYLNMYVCSELSLLIGKINALLNAFYKKAHSLNLYIIVLNCVNIALLIFLSFLVPFNSIHIISSFDWDKFFSIQMKASAHVRFHQVRDCFVFSS